MINSDQISYYREQPIFTIEGSPNIEAKYEILKLAYGRRGDDFADVNYAGGTGKRFQRAVRHEGSVLLDALGRANIEFQVKANRQGRRPGSKPNRVKVQFRLIGLDGNSNNNASVILNPEGCRRHKHFRNNDSKPLFND